MKNSIKVLFAVSIMLFAMSFSTFGATNNETQSKRNVTKAQTQNKSDKGLKILKSQVLSWRNSNKLN